MALHLVDPAHDDDFARWFEVLQSAELYRDRGAGRGWQPDEWRARAIDAVTPIHLLAWSVDDDYVAVAGLHMTTRDNLHTVRCDLFVHPESRRRGYGRRLLGEVEGYARAHGRREVTCFGMEGAHEIGEGPSRGFAPAVDYELADDSRRYELAWPMPPAVRATLLATWRPYALDYEMISFQGRSPEELLEPRARLARSMSSESPWANFEPEEEVWDEDRMRAHEETTEAMGRLLLVTVARERATGQLVGYSELTVSRAAPDTAYQWDTLIALEHRGHRLGGLVKIANLDQLEATGLPVRRVTTFNSTINEPMIRVNLSLGATVQGAAVLWRRDLG